MPTTLQPGDMLPVRELRPLAGGAPARIGSNRPRAQVLVVTHDEPCDPCLAYLDSFASVAESLRAEKGDVLALVGAGWQHHAPSSPVSAALVDGSIRQALSPAQTPVVAIVDRYGQLFGRFDAGRDHSFPDHEQVLSKLLDIGLRCPECGVPDVPSPDVLPEEGTRSGGMVLGQ